MKIYKETHRPIVRIKYFLRVNNVGDRINPDIVSALFPCQTIYYGKSEKPHLIAIGSILSGATALSHVWGAGLMYPQNGPGGAQARSIHALRGKLTYEAVMQAGLALGDIPLGDPAYLVSEIWHRRRPPPKYRLGIVAHYVDRDDVRLPRWLAEEGVVDLDVHDDPEAFLAKMVECEAIASSSLHGLIFAESFGIPNVWLHLSDRVVGDGFKFYDWFSMTAKPQLVPFSPAITDDAAELVKRTALHDCQIDRKTLIDAFPLQKLDELAHELPANRTLYNLKHCRNNSKTPVFVISYNRPLYLTQCIRSYIRLSQHIKIIVHDNGSDDPATILVLQTLEESGAVTVFRSTKINHADELNNVNNTIDAYFADWAEPSRYVVTDCDVEMSTSNADALEVFGELLDLFREAQCVGPMLTIHDIPEGYILYNEVMNRHIEQFWKSEPEWIAVSGGRVAILSAPIDTTFAMHRAGEPFHRLKQGIRVYHPYEARHLDWYSVSDNSDYLSKSSAAISHWGNQEYIDDHRNSSLQFDEFFYVDEQRNTGELITKRSYIGTPLSHAVVIRFHYPETYPKTQLEWRFSYFRTMVLPRLLRQTNQRFVIAVRTTADLVGRFRELSDRITTFTVKDGYENWRPPGYGTEEHATNRKRFFVDFVPWQAVEGLDMYDIQTSIDSDDLILRDDFIDRIESECRSVAAGQSLHIQFQPYIFDVPSLSFYKMPQPYSADNGSPFFSLYQQHSTKFIFAGQDSHRTIGRLMDRSVLVGAGYVALSTHWANASIYLPQEAEKIALPPRIPFVGT